MKLWMILVFGLCFGPNVLFAQVSLLPNVEFDTFAPAFDTDIENESFERLLSSSTLPEGYEFVAHSRSTIKVHSWKAGWDFIYFIPLERTIKCLHLDFSGEYTLLEFGKKEMCLLEFLSAPRKTGPD